LGSSSNFISSIIYNGLRKLKNSEFELAYAIDTAPNDIDTRLMRQDLITTIVRYLGIKVFGRQKISWRWFGEMKGRRVADINSSEFVCKLKLDNIDVILSVGCMQKLGTNLLKSFRCVNYHNSLLPKYRGCLSASWQAYFKEKQTGYTWHYMVEDWDSGKILIQCPVDNSVVRSYDDIMNIEVRKAKIASMDLATLLYMIKTNYKGRNQDGKPSYYGQKEMGLLPKDEWAKACFGWNIAPEEFVPKWMLDIMKL
jgi:folate-dependent phosphoribosylglycinamide formyltransferase PurN